jgi:hypothetical protein
MNPKMSKPLDNGIVHPEPQSSVGRNAWKYFPRWRQILLLLVLVTAGILILIFVKN